MSTLAVHLKRHFFVESNEANITFAWFCLELAWDNSVIVGEVI